MTVDELKAVMIFHLMNFSTNPDSVSQDTKHDEVLSDDGFGTATSARIYKSFIRWTLHQNGHEDTKWPDGWMQMTVNELAPKLID